jgi:hypothetical protein
MKAAPLRVCLRMSATGVKRFTNCPAKAYLKSMEKDFATGSQSDPKVFVASMDTRADLSVEAAPSVAANIASVHGQVHVFVANFSGLVPRKIAVPTVQRGVKISMPAGKDKILRVLPFLGEVHTVQGQRVGDRLVFTLPAFERGLSRGLRTQNRRIDLLRCAQR